MKPFVRFGSYALAFAGWLADRVYAAARRLARPFTKWARR